MTSYYEHNKLAKLNRMLSYLEEGDVALVSEAGMPGISDPGYELIVAAIEHGIPVVPVPGSINGDDGTGGFRAGNRPVYIFRVFTE